MIVKVLWTAVALATAPLLWFLCSSEGSHQLVRIIEYSFDAVAPERCPRADAIAVLAGTGLPRDHRLRSFETPNRMDGALALYGARRAPVLVLTAPEGNWTSAAAVSRGIPEEQVLIAGRAENTADEVRLIAHLAIHHHWRRVILVTSAFHMRRSLLLFQHALFFDLPGPEIIPYPVDWQQIPATPRGVSPGRPNQYGVELFSRSVKELAGWLIYSL